MNNKDLYQVAELQVMYKAPRNPLDCPLIQSSHDAYELALEFWDDHTIDLYEEFKVILLNRSNRVIGILPVSKGGITSTIVDVRVIFASALKTLSTGLVLLHNHPSHNLKPSTSDIGLTQRLVAGGELLDISILDHLIISRNSYYSFTDEGVMPSKTIRNDDTNKA